MASTLAPKAEWSFSYRDGEMIATVRKTDGKLITAEEAAAAMRTLVGTTDEYLKSMGWEITTVANPTNTYSEYWVGEDNNTL